MTIKDKQNDLIKDIIKIRIAVNTLTVYGEEQDKQTEISSALDKLQDKIFTL